MKTKFGKTIRLFLIDGDPSERIIGELSNWTGKAYKIPRLKLKESSDREELKRPGVYMLFGKSEDEKKMVYIGEAENIFDRLKTHLNDTSKDYWTEVILFISKDNYLNKAHIKYLESRLYDLAKNANRYELDNANRPTKSNISESDTAEMEEFLMNVILLTSTLGHRVFEKIIDRGKAKKQDTVFSLQGPRGADAKGVPTNTGFVVFKGSHVASAVVASMNEGSKRLRESLIRNDVIKRHEDKFILEEDYEFSSPSAAASIVLGRSANGLTEWKMSSGKTLKEIEQL